MPRVPTIAMRIMPASWKIPVQYPFHGWSRTNRLRPPSDKDKRSEPSSFKRMTAFMRACRSPAGTKSASDPPLPPPEMQADRKVLLVFFTPGA